MIAHLYKITNNLTNQYYIGKRRGKEQGRYWGSGLRIKPKKERMTTKPVKSNDYLKAKDMLSCGGHIAKDKDTGCEFIVLQGRFTTEVAAFLTSEGIVDADCIVFRGE